MAKHPKDTRPFHFKQFSLFHHRSSMKVGTDATLLGVWADVNSVQSILDVGSGSGIISLLLAARCKARIHAVDIDAASVEESAENFRNSEFSHRLSVEKADFTTFAENCAERYDLIVSNPPFFTNYSFKPKEESRKNARHVDTLNFEQLCAGVARLLDAEGKFCLVLPCETHELFLQTASCYGLFLQRRLDIFPVKNQEANRVNLQLGFRKPKEIRTENHIIRENDRTFTAQHINFLKHYYTGWD
jgi:tRNA1Val (adenine37-N6)-methyltransferase